jgi:succinate dehydrogenase/fumarate reductase cytochrome b subunit
MKKILFISGSILLLPTVAFAQVTLNTFMAGILGFISGVLVPFLFGIAFLVFVVNAVRYFVIQSNNEDGREKAKSLITYSVLAFVFLIVLWGIISVLVSSLGLECANYETKRVTSDYIVKYLPSGPTVSICP